MELHLKTAPLPLSGEPVVVPSLLDPSPRLLVTRTFRSCSPQSDSGTPGRTREGLSMVSKNNHSYVIFFTTDIIRRLRKKCILFLMNRKYVMEYCSDLSFLPYFWVLQSYGLLRVKGGSLGCTNHSPTVIE